MYETIFSFCKKDDNKRMIDNLNIESCKTTNQTSRAMLVNTSVPQTSENMAWFHYH